MGMCVPTKAAETAKMRHPVSPESPMWIVHIDTWYNSDPVKIIDLIPGDILPYVVFNISMNPSWSEEEQSYRHFADFWSFATNPSKILLRNRLKHFKLPNSVTSVGLTA